MEQLKTLLAHDDKDSFTAREIRQQLRIAPGTLKRYLSELERYGYLKGSGNRYRHYEYTINRMDEYEALKSSIDSQLQAIVARIEAKPASLVAQ